MNRLLFLFLVFSNLLLFGQNEPDDYITFRGDTIYRKIVNYSLEKFTYENNKLRRYRVTCDTLILRKSYFENGQIETISYNSTNPQDTIYYSEFFDSNGKSLGNKKKYFKAPHYALGYFNLRQDQYLKIAYRGAIVTFWFSSIETKYVSKNLTISTLPSDQTKEYHAKLNFHYYFSNVKDSIVSNNSTVVFSYEQISKNHSKLEQISALSLITIGNIDFVWHERGFEEIEIYPLSEYQFAVE